MPNALTANAGASPSGVCARVAPLSHDDLSARASRWRASTLPDCVRLADAVEEMLATIDSLRSENTSLRHEVEYLHITQALLREHVAPLAAALGLHTIPPTETERRL